MATFKVNLEGFDDIQRKLAMASSRSEHILAVQVQKDTEDYVPASGAPAGMYTKTQVHGNTIIYPGPYARYLYQGKVMVNAATGKGPMKLINENGVEILRYREGTTLMPTNRDLKIKQYHHPYAQSHWFEASKANNLEKWLRVANRTVKDEFK